MSHLCHIYVTSMSLIEEKRKEEKRIRREEKRIRREKN